ncbi:M13 family metallopeptidase [Nocardia sp. alder85J]|uniref:M13 family metallopeptidase n=1 Tax=Nocardia sp. alder85J TaxID=2862949 RepID=UPI001CD5FC7F|nr:M13 family metallopeptidase [Nocardia sp. alder85J]MCX4093124.1 M13 family metallopeptidase [Nocardia sp. alder85J]
MSGRPARLSRRSLLVALGVVPAAGLLSCTRPAPAEPVLPGPDPAVRPQDDLFRHVNGRWLAEYRLPPDKVSYGTFGEVADLVQGQLHDIVRGIRDPRPGSAEQQIRDLYEARLDLDTIERLGMSPLADLFDTIDSAPGRTELAHVMGRLPIDGLIRIRIAVDRRDSAGHLPVIGQSGLGLGEQYYRRPEFAARLAGYRTLLHRLAGGAGLPDPDGAAQRVFELEGQIASGFWDNIRTRDYDATDNRMSWNELTAAAPGFDWDAWLAGRTDRPSRLFETVVVGEPSFVTAAGGLWSAIDLTTWREYLKLSLIRSYARCLPKAISDANFEFFGTEMGGMRERPDRWKSAIGIVNEAIGQQLGRLYVARHFPPAAKARAQELVTDIMSAYRDSFRDSTWMSPPTRDAAIEKLDRIDAQLGYPDTWIDYSTLRITPGKLVESLRAVEIFDAQRSFEKLGGTVDRSEWSVPPQTVNAFYTATANQITFPAAFLQPPFFDHAAAPAANYGAAGAVIGHEIGHGFDDQGSKYDAAGNRRDWWTPEDRAAFDAKTAQLVAQYDPLTPTGLTPDHHVSGALTVGENLADLRGLTIALAAYRRATERSGATPAYADLFRAWARNWREQQTPETLEHRIATDPHSPGEFRCNQIARNLPEFYTAFDVHDTDHMYLPPDQRVHL